MSPCSYPRDSDSHWTDEVLPMRRSPCPLLGQPRLMQGSTSVRSWSHGCGQLFLPGIPRSNKQSGFLFRPFLETKAFPVMMNVSSFPSPPSCLRPDHTSRTERVTVKWAGLCESSRTPQLPWHPCRGHNAIAPLYCCLKQPWQSACWIYSLPRGSPLVARCGDNRGIDNLPKYVCFVFR